jgi:hypothetical protein
MTKQKMGGTGSPFQFPPAPWIFDLGAYPQLKSNSRSDAYGGVIVVDRREPRDGSCLLRAQSERSPLIRVYRELFYKLPRGREFDNLAGLIRVAVDDVVVSDQQVTIRSRAHGQRSMKVGRILVDDRSPAPVAVGPARLRNSKHGVIQRRSDIQRIGAWVVNQPRGGIHKSRRVALKLVTRGNGGGALHLHPTRGDAQIQA